MSRFELSGARKTLTCGASPMECCQPGPGKERRISEEGLREMGLCSLEERQLRDDLVTI